MTVHKSKRYMKPARKGLVVRQPHNGRPLPAEGAWVAWTGHWVRRHAEGSVVEAQPPRQSKAPAKSPARDQQETD